MKRKRFNNAPERGLYSSRPSRPLRTSTILQRSGISSLNGTVRRPLISTVLADTTLARRSSPQLARRATGRMFKPLSLWDGFLGKLDLPRRAITCAKRSIRREVMFALRSTGRGSKARIRRRSPDSKERC